VSVVTFGPARAQPCSGDRTALVLGAGGVLGAAWMTGALASLQDRLPGPLADVEVMIGTSAGAIMAAALRCGATPAELAGWQRGEGGGPLGELAARAAQAGPLPPLPRLRLGSVPLARAALLRPDRIPPWVGASAWLPSGRGQHAALRSLVTALHQRHYAPLGPGQAVPPWVDGRTWIAAMDYDTGQQVVFGRDGAPAASRADAVVASCSVPGWYQPAAIGGCRYVDGGVRSTTSLAALSGTGVHEVYVLAPMASTEPDHPLRPDLRLERRLRQLLTGILRHQARRLAAEGQRVTLLTPGPQDLAAMGANLMDPRRSRAVLETSLRTSAAALAAASAAGSAGASPGASGGPGRGSGPDLGRTAA
jgi:NTE family protein